MIRLHLLAVALLALAVVPARAGQAPAPVKEITWGPGRIPTAYALVPLGSANFRTAALADVGSKPQKAAQDVQRASNAVSAAYAGVSKVVYTPAPAPGRDTTGEPDSNARYAFKASGDAGQAWATMSATGMPFVDTLAFGEGHASGTASWQAWITTTPGHENLYVRFRLPAATVSGTTEQNGPADWQSRVRAELSVNGHPFWSAESSRMNRLPADYGHGFDNCGDKLGLTTVLSYGAPLGFSEANATSKAKVVNLWLGAFPAGQTVAVSFIVRADALVLQPCCPTNQMTHLPEWFCTAASASVGWDNAPNPVEFWIGPPKV